MFFSVQESGLGAQMRSCLGEKSIGSFHLGHALGSGPAPVPDFLAWEGPPREDLDLWFLFISQALPCLTPQTSPCSEACILEQV